MLGMLTNSPVSSPYPCCCFDVDRQPFTHVEALLSAHKTDEGGRVGLENTHAARPRYAAPTGEAPATVAVS